MIITKTEKDILMISLLVVLYILEYLFPYFNRFKHKSLHALRNIGIIAFNAVILNLFLVPLVVFSTNTSWGIFHFLSFDWKIELILTMIIIDLLTYVLHVLFHKIPFLWRFHRMHHSDTEMDAITGARFHIGEHIISIFVRSGLYATFAMKMEYILFYETVFLANVLFHHANISIGDILDKLYRIFLTSPDMHKVHHSDRRIETDSNYTSLLSVWDRIFGTYKVLENPRRIVYGIKGLETEQT
ncbi:MAG: sterol desaturase family protein, partial [bacterium]|nr:sterol desaturase family protein [bacterium]